MRGPGPPGRDGPARGRLASPGFSHRVRLFPRRDGRLDGRADDGLPGPRPAAAGRVRGRRAAEHSPAAAAARILDRTRGGSYVAVGLSGIAIFGIFLFLTYYLQEVKGYSPVTSGLAFLPMIGCILLSSNVSSIVTLPRLGPRVLITTGMLLGTGAMTYLTQLTVTSSYAGGVLPALLILGLGFGMIFAPAINTATAGVQRQDSGVASALVNTMQQVGGSIGTAALSTIALTATASYLAAHHTGPLAPAIAATHGYTVAFAVSAGIFGLGVILAIVLLPSQRRLAELRASPRPRPKLHPAPPHPRPPPHPPPRRARRRAARRRPRRRPRAAA